MIGPVVCVNVGAGALGCLVHFVSSNFGPPGKVIAAIVVLLASWLGLAVYYFYGRDHLEEWFR